MPVGLPQLVDANDQICDEYARDVRTANRSVTPPGRRQSQLAPLPGLNCSRVTFKAVQRCTYYFFVEKNRISVRNVRIKLKMPYVKPSVATRQLGIDRRTLKKWADDGFISYIQPGGRGQRLYDIDSVNSNHGASEPSSTISVVYGRVSTRKQLPYLRTQLASLGAKYPEHRVISDCASGLNYQRRGLQEILQLAFARRLCVVRVSHKDRLCRFGFDLIEYILKEHGAKIVVETDHSYTAEEDLANDILSVITVFGARLHGKRSGASRKQEGKNKRQRSTTISTTPTKCGEAEEAATVQTTGGADGQPANL